MKARMYDPTIGRFLSTDPIQVGESALAQNPYIYVNNSPLTHIDPSGKFLFLAPLIFYALTAVSAYYAYKDIKTLANPNASTLDKGIASGSLALTPVPGKGVLNVAKAGVKATGKIATKVAEKKAVNYVIRDGIRTQSHHLDPIYLGGSKKAERVIMPVAEHQTMTNAWRIQVPYGSQKALDLKVLAGKHPKEWAQQMDVLKGLVHDEVPIKGFPKEFR